MIRAVRDARSSESRPIATKVPPPAALNGRWWAPGSWSDRTRILTSGPLTERRWSRRSSARRCARVPPHRQAVLSLRYLDDLVCPARLHRHSRSTGRHHRAGHRRPRDGPRTRDPSPSLAPPLVPGGRRGRGGRCRRHAARCRLRRRRGPVDAVTSPPRPRRRAGRHGRQSGSPLEPGRDFIHPDGDDDAVAGHLRDRARGWEPWFGSVKSTAAGHTALSITTVPNLVTDGCLDHTPADPPVGPTVDDLVTAPSQPAVRGDRTPHRRDGQRLLGEAPRADPAF